LDGIDSSYAFQFGVWPKMLCAEVLHFFEGLQSLENGLRLASGSPEVIAT
jgi:hypothetical protein